MTAVRKSGGIGDDCRAWLYARAVTCRGSLTCVYCDARLVRVPLNTRVPPRHVATLDHVVPLARGGTNSPDNVVVSCCSCNALKRDRALAPRAAVLDELSALPSHQALAAWRAKILGRGAARAPEVARWARMLRSKAWASPDAPGLHASRVQCRGGRHRWPLARSAEGGRAVEAGGGRAAHGRLGVNASEAR